MYKLVGQVNDHYPVGSQKTGLIIFFLITINICLFLPLNAQNIYVTGNWTLSISTADLQDGPGSDLNPTYTSSSDQIDIELKKVAKKKDWQVSVRLSHVSWHNDFTFRVRRTSDGRGAGWIAGGLSWIDVSEIEQNFFYGYKNRREISVQCQLDGMSCQIEAGMYTANVIYTVTER